MPLSTVLLNPSFTLVSILNLVHIFSSYVAFKNLNAGAAMTLFYIYPIFNLFLKSIITKTPISAKTIMYFIVCLFGVFMISLNEITSDQTKGLFMVGLISILIASLTESLTYTFYKQENQQNPFDGIFTLYCVGFLLMLLISPKYLEVKNNMSNLSKLLLFNVLIGIVGHLFRFYGIPRVTTEIYSILLFIGVITAYLFGWFFLSEGITLYHIIGTVLILFGVYNVSQNHTVK